MNPQEETFGFERLATLLQNLPADSSAEGVSAAILAATDEFSGRPSEAHDDRTLIVLRLAEPTELQRSGQSA